MKKQTAKTNKTSVKTHKDIGKFYVVSNEICTKNELYTTAEEALKNEAEVYNGDIVYVLKVVAVKKAKIPDLEFTDV